MSHKKTVIQMNEESFKMGNYCNYIVALLNGSLQYINHCKTIRPKLLEELFSSEPRTPTVLHVC